MGRLGNNPSSRAYATPTYATTNITSRETFGGNSKAGLGRHIGMKNFTYSAIVNGSGGHGAPSFAGNSFPAAFKAGRLLDIKYPINQSNQLARIGTGTTGGMTRTPADGINTEQRKTMQMRVDKWNKVWPAMPIRDTPNKCCKSVPDCKCLDENFIIVPNLDVTNHVILWRDENNIINALYFAVTQKVYWLASGPINIPENDRYFGNNYTITNQNIINFTTTDNTNYKFTLNIDENNDIKLITKEVTKSGQTTTNLYDVLQIQIVPPKYKIIALNGRDSAGLSGQITDTYDEAKNIITSNLVDYTNSNIPFITDINNITLNFCNVIFWVNPPQSSDPSNEYGILVEGPYGILIGATNENGNIIEAQINSC